MHKMKKKIALAVVLVSTVLATSLSPVTASKMSFDDYLNGLSIGSTYGQPTTSSNSKKMSYEEFAERTRLDFPGMSEEAIKKFYKKFLEDIEKGYYGLPVEPANPTVNSKENPKENPFEKFLGGGYVDPISGQPDTPYVKPNPVPFDEFMSKTSAKFTAKELGNLRKLYEKATALVKVNKIKDADKIWAQIDEIIRERDPNYNS
ncbi:hypothetical protein PV797_12855 [Clostridiaceae bacterium M8S5]|nr:hypothetical protein PV797_12855 [Clostridiaceae bacterium M8S5]